MAENRRPTLLSLFDGISVFPLAASRYGIIPRYASEIEKAPIAISKRNFPDMEHLGDVHGVHGGKIDPCDIVAFSSPCQDVSICGRRSGLGGDRSKLFFEAIRIIKQMQEASDGMYPSIVAWENVPGVFSSNNRTDFHAVLEAFAQTDLPMPASGRWANAGMVRGSSNEIAWRVLDAQLWGVPQRRKRVFLVSDYRGQRAAQILFAPEYLPDDPAQCQEASVHSTGAASDDTGKAERANTRVAPIHASTTHPNSRASGVGIGGISDPFPTLTVSDRHAIATWWDGGQTAETLVSTIYKRHSNPHRRQFEGILHEGVARRPTCRECERLMGLPDDWTKYGKDGELISDTARYKALGNAIVLPCAEYIMKGIAEALRP